MTLSFSIILCLFIAATAFILMLFFSTAGLWHKQTNKSQTIKLTEIVNYFYVCHFKLYVRFFILLKKSKIWKILFTIQQKAKINWNIYINSYRFNIILTMKQVFFFLIKPSFIFPNSSRICEAQLLKLSYFQVE